MMKRFKSITKELSQLFSIPITTLAKWSTSESRTSHRQLLEYANYAVTNFSEYHSLLSAEEPLEVIAKELGFDAPLSMTLEGIPARTFRSWFDTDTKRKLVIGILIGTHWEKLQEAAVKSNCSSTVVFLKKLNAKKINAGDYLRIYMISPVTVTKLISDQM